MVGNIHILFGDVEIRHLKEIGPGGNKEYCFWDCNEETFCLIASFAKGLTKIEEMSKSLEAIKKVVVK